jgi:tryptophan halogenase
VGQERVAIGLAGGFIEPLESTALHLIYKGMDYLLRFFPDMDADPTLAAEYNRRMTADYEEIRDFIVLHYVTTERDDTPFWRDYQQVPLPESLKRADRPVQAPPGCCATASTTCSARPAGSR